MHEKGLAVGSVLRDNFLMDAITQIIHEESTQMVCDGAWSLECGKSISYLL